MVILLQRAQFLSGFGMASACKNQSDPILITQSGSVVSSYWPVQISMLVKYEIQKQLPPQMDRKGGEDKMGQSSPPPPPLPYAILLSSPCNAVISMENMVGWVNEVFLSAGQRVEAENTLDRFKCTCSQRASYDWNSISALASHTSKSSMCSLMINGLYL